MQYFHADGRSASHVKHCCANAGPAYGGVPKGQAPGGADMYIMYVYIYVHTRARAHTHTHMAVTMCANKK